MKGSQWRPLAARPGWRHMRQEQGSVPAVVFDHVVEFNDVLPLFVLLAALEGLFLKGGKRLLRLEVGQGLTKRVGVWGVDMMGPILQMRKLSPKKPSHLPTDTELINGRARYNRG